VNQTDFKRLRQLHTRQLHRDQQAKGLAVEERAKHQQGIWRVVGDKGGGAFVGKDAATGHDAKTETVGAARPGEAASEVELRIFRYELRISIKVWITSANSRLYFCTIFIPVRHEINVCVKRRKSATLSKAVPTMPRLFPPSSHKAEIFRCGQPLARGTLVAFK